MEPSQAFKLPLFCIKSTSPHPSDADAVHSLLSTSQILRSMARSSLVVSARPSLTKVTIRIGRIALQHPKVSLPGATATVAVTVQPVNRLAARTCSLEKINELEVLRELSCEHRRGPRICRINMFVHIMNVVQGLIRSPKTIAEVLSLKRA